MIPPGINKWALVEWSPVASVAPLVRLSALAGEQRGTSQAETVQLVAGLAVLRTRLVVPDGIPAALYDEHGSFSHLADIPNRGLAVEPTGESIWERPFRLRGSENMRALGVAGQPRLSSNAEANRLALAIDGLLYEIADLKTGPEAVAVPHLALGPAVLPAIPIIVAGAAAAIVGVVAAWRYFDPETAQRTVEVATAAEAFRERMAIEEATGIKTEPSPIELAAAKSIENASKQGSNGGWISMALLTGGTLGALGMAVALRRAAA